MKRIINYIKKEAVLCVSVLLASISCVFVHPDKKYFGYIDFRVIALLFCLMLCVAGLRKCGIFEWLEEKLCSGIKQINTLTLCFVFLCFFSSMLITNDVALITFVPFTMIIFEQVDCVDRIIYAVVLETLAANLGSMLTPIGNPQNLYLIGKSGMSVGGFVIYMLPLSVAAFALLILCTLIRKNRCISIMGKSKSNPSKKAWLYCVMFVLCILCVAHIISYQIMLAVIVICVLLCEHSLYKEAYYSLLATFAGFFIFTGNVTRIDSINRFLVTAVSGHEVAGGIITSQIISNVPAAMLLSAFTVNIKALIYGVNLGGLGTIIASMASLISYKYYVKRFGGAAKYLLVFTLFNIVFLAVLLIVAIIVN